MKLQNCINKFKKSNPIWVGFLFSLLLSFPFQGKAQHEYGSLIYEVVGKKKKKPSYVYGTIHISDDRVFHFSSQMEKAFAKSKVFAMEMLLDQASPFQMLGDLMMKDSSLSDLVSPEEYKKVETFFEDEIGMPLLLLKKVKPFFLTAIISEKGFKKDRDQPLDLHLMSLAKDDKKKVIGLETMAEQLAVVDMLPLKQQAKMLMEAIEMSEDTDQSGPDMDTFLDYYLEGKLDSLAILSGDYSGDDLFEKEFIINRNHIMVERALPFIEKKPTFIAVGALHLPGEEGILNLLREKGYTVRPLK